jgi:peptidoglycan hydrolase-like protein with peptidoglycan-binding domain
MPQFKQGGSGPSIRKIQTLLNARNSAGLAVDGMFGPRTREAVIAHQRAVHLRPDGIVGIQTLASLAFADPKEPPTIRPAGDRTAAAITVIRTRNSDGTAAPDQYS